MKRLLQTSLKACFILMLLFNYHSAIAQCTSGTSFGGATANNFNTPQTLTTCAFGGEYSPYSGVTAGNTYSFTATGGSGNFITVRQTNGTGTIVASGVSPLTGVISPVSGVLAVIVHVDAACTTDSNCHTLIATCTSCPAPPVFAPINIPAIPVTNQSLVCNTANDYNSTNVPATCGSATNAYKGGNEAVYTFTPTATGSYDISISGVTWTSIFVYAGNPTSGGTCVNSVGTSASSKSLTVNLTSGTQYYIWFDTNPSPASPCPGTFSLVATPPPPANDNCAGAIALTVNADLNCSASTAGTTASATQSTETAPSCSATGVNDDVWYTFVAQGAAHQVRITGATNTTAAAVYTGSCGSLTQVTGACNSTLSGTMNLNLTGLSIGTTYRVRVYTTSTVVGTTSNFTICIGTPPPPPVNDECATATALSVGIACNYTQYTTASATGSVGAPAPGCASYSGGDVWFTAVVPATGRLIIDSNTGVITDGGMAIYSGNCGVLTLIECDDDDSANGLMPLIDRSGLTPGSTIYIRFWEFSNDNPGTFSLCVWAPAPPCNSPGVPVISNITSNSASVNWAAAAGAVSYDWTVGTGGSCPTGTGANTATTSVNLNNLIPNTTYRVCVRTSTCGGGSASSYETVTFTTAPLANDACAGAIPLACNSTVNGTTVGAVSDSGQGSCGVAGSPGNGVWYSLAGDGSQITLDLCGSAYDTKVHVYSGSCAGLACVISNDDNATICTSATTRSQVVFNTVPGTTYYILVSGFGSATGAFTMNVGCVCGAPLSFPWSNNPVGAGTTGEGIDNVCGGSIDISSTGYSPSLSSDALFFSSQSLCGNQSITVKVQSITNGGFAGIMFRDTVSAGSRFVAIKTQLNPYVQREIRSVANGPRQVQQLPAFGHTWLRLTRNGNTFTGFTSSNGINWNQAFSVNVALNTCIRVGLFAQGINPSSTAQAQFSMITGFAPTFIPFSAPDLTINEGVQGVSVFPNPTSNELNLKIGSEYLGKNISIHVLDQMGRVVLQKDINDLQSQQEQINVSNLPGGLYILSLMSEGQAAQVQKFIVSGNRP